jgi:DNA-binding response OmpR family regulator
MSGTTGERQSRSIYVVEDNAELGRLICATLNEYSFQSEHFLTGNAFLRRLKKTAPVLSIIDLGLPDIDGMQLVRQAQTVSDSAILILTGRQHVSDRILGLELGADDYMVKPFEPREVVARINSILRRIERSREETGGGLRVAQFRGWTFEVDRNRLISPSGCEVELSSAESGLLEIMLKRPNRILSRTDLLGSHAEECFDRSIDARISRLRRKLSDNDDAPEVIKTVYGAGYMLLADVKWA